MTTNKHLYMPFTVFLQKEVNAMIKLARISYITILIALLYAISVFAYSAYPNNIISKYTITTAADDETDKTATLSDGKFSYGQKLKFNTLEQLKISMPEAQKYQCELVKTYMSSKPDNLAKGEGYERRCYPLVSDKKIKYYSIPDKRQVLAYTLEVDYW